MGIISRAIPTLLRGVSQAADSTKQPDHADLQENADSSPVQGLQKRSGVKYETVLANFPTASNVHVHTINREVGSRYVAVFSDEAVKVYDINGTEKTVHTPDGVAYLDTSNPRGEIKTVTIADYTFVVNTSKTVAIDNAVSSGGGTGAIVFVNQASAETDYTVTVNSTTATYNTGTTNLKTSVVTEKLKDKLLGQNGESPTSGSALSGFTISQNGPVLWIRKNDSSDFSIDTSDTQGNRRITLVKNAVQEFNELPTVAPNNFVVEIKGDDSSNFDNYYVKFVTNNGGTFEDGQWEESLKAGITYKYDHTTMPHVLVRQADGHFRFAKVDGDTYTVSGVNYTLPKWGERTVGDLDSAPTSSFVGNKINNVLFFRNRLGFLSNDNIVLSRVSEFFNFFPETVTTVIDSDPIDVAASHTKVAILKHAITMGEQLILFSDQTQFVLESSADNLTPKTANVIVATEFENSPDATPVGSGNSIYYLTQKGSYAGIREYITQENVAIKDAANITIHIPKYIPANIYKLAVSTSEDILVLLGTDNPNKLYINRWLFGKTNEKILNSWSTFSINSSRSILNIDFINSDLYLVIRDTNNLTTLERIPFEPDYKEANSTFQYYLDHKLTEATSGVSVAYNNQTDTTTWTLPYRTYANMAVVGRYLAQGETSTYVDTQGANQTLKPGQLVTTTTTNTSGAAYSVNAEGNYTGSKVIIGEPYEMHYRFTRQRLTEKTTTGTGSEYIGGRLQLHHFYIKYEDTGHFKVEVTPDHKVTSTHKFTGQLLGTASATLGEINLETGTFRVPIMSRADSVNIDIKNDTFLPTQLSSAEYEARFHMRSRRI